MVLLKFLSAGYSLHFITEYPPTRHSKDVDLQSVSFGTMQHVSGSKDKGEIHPKFLGIALVGDCHRYSKPRAMVTGIGKQ